MAEYNDNVKYYDIVRNPNEVFYDPMNTPSS